LIDPERQKERNYRFLLEVHDYAIGLLKPGIQCKDVYGKIIEYVQGKREDLVQHLPKNFGFGMGLEFREALFVLGFVLVWLISRPKSSREVKEGMIFNLAIGFQDLENPDGAKDRDRSYALLVSDTVQVMADKSVILTDVTKIPSDISYIFKEQGGDAAEGVEAKEGDAPAAATRPSTILENTRRDNRIKDQITAASTEAKRREHQIELAKQKQIEGISRFEGNTDGAGGENRLAFKKYGVETNLGKIFQLQKGNYAA
jgi:nucleosome binding factor SPN SPT16 subunit